MADLISGEVGDEGRSVAIGKGIHQTDRSNRVNVYNTDRRSQSLEERVEDLERYTFGDNRYDEVGMLRRQKTTQLWVQGLAALLVLVILAQLVIILFR